MILELKDSKNSIIKIYFGGFLSPLVSNNPIKIDCVTISPRYDHGFGFSKLFRVVDDKDSIEIKNLLIHQILQVK